MGNLIDGRSIAEKVYVDLRREIADLKSKGVTPGIAVVLVGDNPASRTYVRSKDKMSRELGLHSVKLELPASTTQSFSKATPCTVAPSRWSSRTKIGIHTPVMGARSSSHPQSDY